MRFDRLTPLSLPGDDQPITEYFTPAGLDYFLSVPASKRTKSGLLQGFVNPKGTSNFLIRAVWTPDDCAIDSCININKLSDPDLPAQDRAATNDERNCVLIPLAANALAAQLRRACACIAEHIAAVAPSASAVTRMTLNFKIDSMVRCLRPSACPPPPPPPPPSPQLPRRERGGSREEWGASAERRGTGSERARRLPILAAVRDRLILLLRP